MRYIKIALLVLLPSVVSGQTLINIYQSNGTLLHVPMASVDSARFNTAGGVTFQSIFQSNLNVLKIATNSIDSITYTTPLLKNLPVLTTTGALNITSFSANTGGNITSQGGDTITQRGVCWSTHLSPTLADNHTNNGLGTGSYTSSMLPLLSKTTYHIRAYATNSYGTAYGNELTFITLKGSGDLPTVTTDVLSDTTGYSVKSGGEVTSDGGSAVVSRGICWASGVTPTISNSITIEGSGAGIFKSTASNLLASSTYFVRAYATNSAGTAYGNSYTVTTYPWPVIKILEIKDITPNSYHIRGTVTDNVGLEITGIGVALGVDPFPTAEENKRFTTTLSQFESGFIDWNGIPFELVSNTRYHLRAFTISKAGIIYGDTLSIVMAPAYPDVETYDVIKTGGKTATIGGRVLSKDGAPITLRGMCYTTDRLNVNINADTVISSNDTGVYSSFIDSLMPNRTYYFRAFAMNDSFEVKYGGTKNFTTCNVPSLGITKREKVYADSAYVGGTITDNGGCDIISRGVVWNLAQNATLDDSVIYSTDTSTSADFSTFLANLEPNHDYYARAFAINDAGVGYGQQFTLSTQECVDGLCIGQEYQGGLISYILKPGDTGYDKDTVHGYISASKIIGSAVWGCYGTDIAGTTVSGKTNTEAIMAQSCNTSSSAASKCYNLTLKGYSDWYLPSPEELRKVFYNLKLNGLGDNLATSYWSSYQCSGHGAMFVSMTRTNNTIYTHCNVSKSTPSKTNSLDILPIRYF